MSEILSEVQGKLEMLKTYQDGSEISMAPS